MALRELHKYGPRLRFKTRSHAHGWAGWVCRRWKLKGQRRSKRERSVEVLRFF